MHIYAAMRGRRDIGFAHAQVGVATDDDARTQPRPLTHRHALPLSLQAGKANTSKQEKSRGMGKASVPFRSLLDSSVAAAPHSFTEQGRQLPLTSASHPGRSGRAQSGQLHRWPAPPGRRMPAATRQGCGQPYCSQGGHSSLALAKTQNALGVVLDWPPHLTFCLPTPNCRCPCAQELLNVAQHAQGRGVKCRTPPACHASTWNHWGSGCCQQRPPLWRARHSFAWTAQLQLQAQLTSNYTLSEHVCQTRMHTHTPKYNEVLSKSPPHALGPTHPYSDCCVHSAHQASCRWSSKANKSPWRSPTKQHRTVSRRNSKC